MPVRRVKPKNVPQKQPPAPSNDAKTNPVYTSIDRESAPPTAAKKSKDYDVGYQKPPKSGQFKKGQSGNPKGRPKGAKNLNNMVLAMLKERVWIKTPDGMRKLSKIEAIVMKWFEMAGKGNVKAMLTLFVFRDQHALLSGMALARLSRIHSDLCHHPNSGTDIGANRGCHRATRVITGSGVWKNLKYAACLAEIGFV